MKITLPKIVRRVPVEKSGIPSQKPAKNKKSVKRQSVKKKQTWIDFVVLGLMLAGIVSWIIEQLNDPLTTAYLKLLSFTNVVNVQVTSIAIGVISIVLVIFKRFNWLPLLLPLFSYIISIQNRQTATIYLTFWVLASVLICEYYFPKYIEVFFGIGLIILLFFKVWLGAIAIILMYLWNRFYVINK